MLKAVVLLVLALVVASAFSEAPPLRAVNSGPNFSTVYFFPPKTCCKSENVPYQPGNTFSVSVNLTLLAGESFNAFDVKVNYTNPHYQTASGTVQGVLQAISLDYSQNVFATSPYSFQVLAYCIDGGAVGNIGSASACATDTVGQVHLAEVLTGPHNITGPLTGELFTVNFQVWGSGYSIFTPDRTQFVTPGSFTFIPIRGESGVFGNQGLIAFFTYRPDYAMDTLFSPSLIPNQPVLFDASGTFVADNSSIIFKSYSWDFGDGKTGMGVSVNHTYARSGNYTVSLNVTDVADERANISRIVSVLPALGGLALTVDDSSGTHQNANVQVSVFNSSSSPSPFSKQTISKIGDVTFSNLSPGDYHVTFSGPGFVTMSKTEKVIPGFTVTDTVYIQSTPRSPDYSGLVYLASILGGIGILTAAIIYQKRKSSSQPGKRKGQIFRKKSKPSKP